MSLTDRCGCCGVRPEEGSAVCSRSLLSPLNSLSELHKAGTCSTSPLSHNPNKSNGLVHRRLQLVISFQLFWNFLVIFDSSVAVPSFRLYCSDGEVAGERAPHRVSRSEDCPVETLLPAAWERAQPPQPPPTGDFSNALKLLPSFPPSYTTAPTCREALKESTLLQEDTKYSASHN